MGWTGPGLWTDLDYVYSFKMDQSRALDGPSGPSGALAWGLLTIAMKAIVYPARMRKWMAKVFHRVLGFRQKVVVLPV